MLEDSKASLEIYSKIENFEPGVIFYSENNSNDVYALTIGRTANNEIFIDSVKEDSTGGSLNLMPTTGGSLILPKKLIQNNKCLITFSNNNSVVKQISSNDVTDYKDIDFANNVSPNGIYYFYDPEGFISTTTIFRPGLAGYYKIKTEIILGLDNVNRSMAICLPNDNIISAVESSTTRNISTVLKIEDNDLLNPLKNGFKVRVAFAGPATTYIKYFYIEIEYLGN